MQESLVVSILSFNNLWINLKMVWMVSHQARVEKAQVVKDQADQADQAAKEAKEARAAKRKVAKECKLRIW